MHDFKDVKLAIVGMGYVGLPLAVEFGKLYDTLGFDINPRRIAELRAGRDSTCEVEPADLAACPRLRYSDSAAELADRNVFIVTVPTPIDQAKRPDLTPLPLQPATLPSPCVRQAIGIHAFADEFNQPARRQRRRLSRPRNGVPGRQGGGQIDHRGQSAAEWRATAGETCRAPTDSSGLHEARAPD